MDEYQNLTIIEKSADYATIKQFLLKRLRSTFKGGVSENPRLLYTYYIYNSKGVPIYLLCFAVGNPRGAETALRIADHILKNW